MIGLVWWLFGWEFCFGELCLLFVVLVIVVVVVMVVGFFVDCVCFVFECEVQQLMGGDFVLIVDYVLLESYVVEVCWCGLQIVEILIFLSMVFGGEQVYLVDIKVVSMIYLLCGCFLMMMCQGELGKLVVGGL